LRFDKVEPEFDPEYDDEQDFDDQDQEYQIITMKQKKEVISRASIFREIPNLLLELNQREISI